MTTPIDGTPGNDLLTGTESADLILGYGGNDRLVGLGGDDTLDGGAGTNQIDAGDGNDLILLDGSAVNGALRVPATGIDGGAGIDTIQFAGAVADFHIVQIAGGWLQVDDLVNGGRTIAANVEHLQFSDTEIWLVPHSVPAVVSGDMAGAVTEDGGLVTSGQLLIVDPDPGEAGFVAGQVAGAYGTLTLDAAGAWTYVLNNDALAVQVLAAGEVVQDSLTVTTLDGTTAQVVMTVTGAADASLILGTDRGERLTGTKAGEHIFGQGGADRINAAAGDDVISGGAGADVFLFSGRFGHDVITDFETATLNEVIDLSRVDGLHGFADLQAHHMTEVAGNAVLSFGAHDITLQGVAMASLTSGDFLF